MKRALAAWACAAAACAGFARADAWRAPREGLDQRMQRAGISVYYTGQGDNAFPADRVAPLSIINEQGGRRVRMGHLAFIGSHRVNGVSGLHGKLIAGVGRFLRLYELGKRKLLRKCENKVRRSGFYQDPLMPLLS